VEPTLKTINEAIRIAWETGDLRHKLQWPQHTPYDQFYEKKISRRRVWCAGRRCKKSTLMLILFSELCIKNPGGQTDFVAPVEKGLSAYMAPIIKDVFADCPGDLMPKYSEKHNHLLFEKQDSRVIFNGCNMQQYKYMRGQKLLAAGVDEMQSIDNLVEAVDDVLYPATWDSKGMLILSGTPPPVPDPEDPIMKYIEAAKADGYYWHSTVYEAGYTHEHIAEALRETSKGAINQEESTMITELCDPSNGYSVAQIYEMALRVGIKKESLTVFLREFMAEFIRDESTVIIPEWDDKFVQVLKPTEFWPLYSCYMGMDV
jgi:hypothetical protein